MCRLRSESVRGQLEGLYPATLAQQAEHPGAGVDASHIALGNLGDFGDLERAKERQDAAAAMAERRSKRTWNEFYFVLGQKISNHAKKRDFLV